MKMCWSTSWCLPVLLLVACVSSDTLTRNNARRGATLGSYKQDWPGPSLAEAVLWDLLQMANEATEADERRNGVGGAEELPPVGRVGGGERDLPVPLGPRERKAGCKNFFWKTFTSC
ncbi:somatostatin-2 [Syngnathus scovelli]|uniref:somatostatin-2 n=1 Tax=Syngnathus scovelli TaxID=161590 RepID=UPI00210FB654|nr:somatostatin-2 [Syngnathus scovelli]